MKIVILMFIIIQSIICNAQINLGGIPHSWVHNLEYKIPVYTTEKLDLRELEFQDRNDELSGFPPRFGYKHKSKLDLTNSGRWIKLENGDKIWQLEIICPTARSVNFTFDKYWLPEGAKLYIYSKDKKHLIGAFSNLNNKGSREELRGFGCGLVYSDNVVLELYQPSNKPQAIISINGIVHGYRYIPKFWDKEEEVRNYGDSNNCQVNINCSPEGDNWQNEKEGVALVLVDGNRHCTGTLVNNTCNDGELYFLTAEHCLWEYPGSGSNIPRKDAITNPIADDWSFLWNYETPNCSNPVNEPNLYVTNGATVVANSKIGENLVLFTDFALLKLTESPYLINPPLDITFNGWSRTTNPTAGGVGIHHPRGDVKKVSTYSMIPAPSSNCVPSNGSWWEISWDQTVNGFSIMENGSSGSALFNTDGLIIGNLYGSYFCTLKDCDNAELQKVVYGRFHKSWEAGVAIERQLKHWLDPCGTNQIELEGGYYDPCKDLVVVSNPINGNAYYQAEEDIIANSVLSSTSTVEMKAEVSLTLSPNFHAQSGSDFWGHIESCMPQVLPIFKQANSGKNDLASIVTDKPKFKFNVLAIYPNPANASINIEFYLVEDEKVTISITDLSGKRIAVYENKHAGSSTYNAELDVSNFPTGLYLVTLTTSNYTQTEKLMIER